MIDKRDVVELYRKTSNLISKCDYASCGFCAMRNECNQLAENAVRFNGLFHFYKADLLSKEKEKADE